MSLENKTRRATVTEIISTLQKKREAFRDNIQIHPVVVRRGYLDTCKCFCLTSDEAMRLIHAKEARR